MAIDWTTFALEVVNFLVLVWLLQRFLYRPVREVLARRQAGVTRTLEEARQAETAAAELQAQFERRLADWEAEKAHLRAGLQAELEAERGRQLQALTQTLAAERERQQAQEAHRQDQQRHELEGQAIQVARGFATRLLSRLAGPELERRLIDVFIEDLAHLPQERLAELDAAALGEERRVLITSAFPVAEVQRQRIAAALNARLGRSLALSWAEDAELLAGLRVALGPWQLDLSLADELDGFAQAGNHGG
ncbi:MAG TPA: F0F1 ATP synthase subunit delta [Chromatiaceae bacterium]|nr:F0F1 ATP synthase subunit delta [Chromatiaceae bacterium]